MKRFGKVLVLGLCAGILSGCALLEKTPAPEELIDGIAEMEFDGYVDFTLKGNYYIEMDGDGKGIEGRVDVEYTKDVYHSKEIGLQLTMYGVTADDIGIERWIDKEYHYGNMQFQDGDYGWVYAEMTSRDYKDLPRLEDTAGEISAELFDDLELEEREKKGNYVVIGTMAGDDLYELMEDIFANNQTQGMIMEDVEDFTDDIVLDVKAEFDYETRALIKIEITLNAKESDIPRDVDELEITLKLTINEIDPDGGDRLEIPEEVTEEPVPLEEWQVEMAQLITGEEEAEEPEDTDENGISDDEMRQIEGRFLFLETNIRQNVPEADITVYDRLEESGWLGGKVLNYSYYDEDGTYLEGEFRYYLEEEDAEWMFIVMLEMFREKYGDPVYMEEVDGTYGADFNSENATEAVELYQGGKNFIMLRVVLGSDARGSRDILDDKLDDVLHNAIYSVNDCFGK